MNKIMYVFLLGLVVSGTCYGQKLQEAFTLDDVMSAAMPTELTVSSISSTVAWVQTSKGVRNLFIAQGPDYEGRQLTSYNLDDGQEISSLIIDDKHNNIIYVKGGAPNNRGEIPNPSLNPSGAKRQLYRVGMSSAHPQLISDGHSPALAPDGSILVFIKDGQIYTIDPVDTAAKETQLTVTRGRVSNVRWSPNSRGLAFVSNRSEHSFIGVYDFSKESLLYLSPSVDHDFSPVWSPSGNEIAFIREPNESENLPFMPRREALPWSIWVANSSSGVSEMVWKASEGTGSAFRFISSSDQLMWGQGNQLVFPYEGDGWTHLYAVNRNTKKVVLLTPGNFEVQFVSLSADGNNVWYSSNGEDIDRQHIWRVSPEGGKPEQITSGNGIEWAPKILVTDNTLMYMASGPTTPAHAVFRKNGSDKGRLLDKNAIPPKFPSKHLITPKQVIFTSVDGMQIHGQLFMPKNIKSGEKRPALLHFHGGSRRQMWLGFHYRGYYHNAYAMNQYMAGKGYIVLSVNYRSGIGYGMKFREALNYGARGASEYNDVVGAGNYLKSLPQVDEERIGLWGGSYGGFLTAMGLARASDLFAAGVDIHGVHDWNIVIKNFVPSYDAGKNLAASKLAFESSPMAYVSTWRSPVLLVHGDDDRNVPFSESVHMAESLRKQGVEVEQLIFPDEVHGFLMYKSWIAAFKAAADFFDRKLK